MAEDDLYITPHASQNLMSLTRILSVKIDLPLFFLN
jgi:hypothetical protein